MRKLTAVLACALLLGLVPGASVGAQEPGVDASVNEFAYATNIVHEDGADYMYIVGAQRTAHAGGRTKTTAYAKRTKCLTLERKHIKLIACAAFVAPRRIPDAAFAFDPLMDSASVRFRRKGARTAMSWRGRGTPEPSIAPYADESYGAGAFGELWRNARARGKILGERYPKGRFGFAVLMEGVAAEGYPGRGVRITPMSDGTLRVEARYRVPR